MEPWKYAQQQQQQQFTRDACVIILWYLYEVLYTMVQTVNFPIAYDSITFLRPGQLFHRFFVHVHSRARG